MDYLEQLDADVRRIELDLSEIPEKIADAERAQANDRRRLDELKESLEIAEMNAMLAAQADGKDAKTRDLQRQGATWQDADVKRWQGEIAKAQQSLDDATVSADMLRRRFSGVSHIAQLRAAQINLMAGMPEHVR